MTYFNPRTEEDRKFAAFRRRVVLFKKALNEQCRVNVEKREAEERSVTLQTERGEE